MTKTDNLDSNVVTAIMTMPEAEVSEHSNPLFIMALKDARKTVPLGTFFADFPKTDE